MKLKVQKTHILNGEITPPASKSQSIRAILLATLAHGESFINHILKAEDTDDALNISQALGAEITIASDQLKIKSNGTPFKTAHPTIFSGNSGITTHFVMPILGLRENNHEPIILDCGEQMQARPVKPLVESLINLGLTIEYQNSRQTLPIKISGELRGGKTTVDGTTSQYLSALLFALPCAKEDSEITVENLQERSYVDMTLNFLTQQNIQYQHQSFKGMDIYQIQGRQRYHPIHMDIPSDFSSASYLIAAAVLMPGNVIIHRIDMNELQGDKRLIAILQEMGANITIEANRLIIEGGCPLKGIPIDGRDIPDLLPTLSVIGTKATGKTEIYNVAHARIKETDRIHSMAKGLTRMKANIKENSDGITIHQSALKGSLVEGFGDHRTIMALSIAGLLADGDTLIDDAAPINKTYPLFISDMQSLGAKMECHDE